jgi:hypothetical protein
MHNAQQPLYFCAPNDVIRYTIEELLDIATQYATSEDTPGLSLSQAEGKHSPAAAK